MSTHRRALIGLSLIALMSASFMAGSATAAERADPGVGPVSIAALTPGQQSVLQTVNWLLLGQDSIPNTFLPIVRK
jgi:hypothetical protein